MRISDWSSDVCSSDLEKHYPGRVSATALQNPDFAAYAQAFGGHGERVESTDQFAPAFERALASGKPAILHCLLDPETLSPSTTPEKIRDAALAARNSRRRNLSAVPYPDLTRKSVIEEKSV